MAIAERMVEENENDESEGHFYEDYGTEEMLVVETSQCSAIGNRFPLSRRNFYANKGQQKQSAYQNASEAKPKRLDCFNCKSESHYMIDCDQPITRRFCFRCGKEDTLAPNCECKANRQPSKNIMNVAAISAENCDNSNLTPQ